jgi:hypothetical protein
MMPANELTRRIDHAGIRRSGKVLSDLRDLPIRNEDVVFVSVPLAAVSTVAFFMRRLPCVCA